MILLSNICDKWLAGMVFPMANEVRYGDVNLCMKCLIVTALKNINVAML